MGKKTIIREFQTTVYLTKKSAEKFEIFASSSLKVS